MGIPRVPDALEAAIGDFVGEMATEFPDDEVMGVSSSDHKPSEASANVPIQIKIPL